MPMFVGDKRVDTAGEENDAIARAMDKVRTQYLTDSFTDSLMDIQNRELRGEIVAGSDPSWATVYTALAKTAEVSPENSAAQGLMALQHIQNNTQKYDAIQHLFMENIANLEKEGKTEIATKLLAMAVEQKVDAIGSHISSKGATNADLVEKIQNLNVAALSQLDPNMKEKLIEKFQVAADSLANSARFDDTDEKQNQYQNQAERLRNIRSSTPELAPDNARDVHYKPADVSSPPPGDERYKVPAGWNQNNVNQYLDKLEAYSKTDLAGATVSIAHLLTAPAVKGAPEEATFWHAFTELAGRIDKEKGDEAHSDISAEHRAIQKIWASLPEGDEMHRKMLQSIALESGMGLGEKGNPVFDAQLQKLRLERNVPAQGR